MYLRCLGCNSWRVDLESWLLLGHSYHLHSCSRGGHGNAASASNAGQFARRGRQTSSSCHTEGSQGSNRPAGCVPSPYYGSSAPRLCWLLRRGEHWFHSPLATHDTVGHVATQRTFDHHPSACAAAAVVALLARRLPSPPDGRVGDRMATISRAGALHH